MINADTGFILLTPMEFSFIVDHNESIYKILVKSHDGKHTLLYAFLAGRNDGLRWVRLIKYYGQRKREADEFKKN
jgi:hypothetical protein